MGYVSGGRPTQMAVWSSESNEAARSRRPKPLGPLTARRARDRYTLEPTAPPTMSHLPARSKRKQSPHRVDHANRGI